MTSIKFTDKHLSIIEEALEAYFRIKTGQISMGVSNFFPSIGFDIADEIEDAILDYARQQKDCQKILDKFGKRQEDTDIAFEIRQTIRQFLSVKRNNGFFNNSLVSFDDPLKMSNEPLPVIDEEYTHKDIPIDNPNLISLIKKCKYKEAWNLFDSLNLKIRGEKMKFIFSDDNLLVRVYKPYLNNKNGE